MASPCVLPVGTIHVGSVAAAAVRLSRGVGRPQELRDWFDRLASGNHAWIWLPTCITQSDGGAELTYGPDLKRSEGLGMVIAQWAGDPRTAIPLIMQLGRFVLMVSDHIRTLHVEGAAMSSAFIRVMPDERTPFRFLPLPTGQATLADWARASPESWLWLPPAMLLATPQSGEPDVVHTVGAALSHALAGALLPEMLPAGEQFRRVLAGRVGMPARLDAAVRAAIPAGLGAHAEALIALVGECLNAAGPARPDTGQLSTRLTTLERALNPEVLISAWQAEDQPAVAARILNRIRQATPTTPPPPPGRDTWTDIARQQLGRGELQSALDSAWNAIAHDGPAGMHMYMGVLQSIPQRQPERVGELAPAINRLIEGYGRHIDESDFLRIIHLRMRYLEAPEADWSALERPYESSWSEAVSYLLRALVCVRRGGEYTDASRLCKAARMRFTAMPQGGGEAGAYARAYLDLIDGIAHLGFIGASGQTHYYPDAFECMARCLTASQQIQADDLVRAGTRWLGWLTHLTGQYHTPPLSLIHAAAAGILRSMGLLEELTASGRMPGVPWYNDAVLFPV